jgi:hypothetical protein
MYATVLLGLTAVVLLDIIATVSRAICHTRNPVMVRFAIEEGSENLFFHCAPVLVWFLAIM